MVRSVFIFHTSCFTRHSYSVLSASIGLTLAARRAAARIGNEFLEIILFAAPFFHQGKLRAALQDFIFLRA
jgi:hypothetical protein